MIDGLTLRGEISAFYRGARQPARLDRAFRNAPLLVPLTDDEDVCMAVMGGIQWICAFSSEEEMDRYRDSRTDMTARRFITVPGWRLMAAGNRPTCVIVDVKSQFPMSFPPPLTAVL